MAIGPQPIPSEDTFSEWCEDALAHGVEPEEMSPEYRKPFKDYIAKTYGIVNLDTKG